MLTKAELYNRYLKHSLHRPGIYLGLSAACDFVAECENNNLAVIGIECFTMYTDGSIEPRSDLIADCAFADILNWAVRRQTCNECAKSFLTELPDAPGLVVNFVVISADGRPGSVELANTE